MRMLPLVALGIVLAGCASYDMFGNPIKPAHRALAVVCPLCDLVRQVVGDRLEREDRERCGDDEACVRELLRRKYEAAGWTDIVVPTPTPSGDGAELRPR